MWGIENYPLFLSRKRYLQVLFFVRLANYSPLPICPTCKKYKICKKTCKELENILINIDLLSSTTIYLSIYYKKTKNSKKVLNIKLPDPTNHFKSLSPKEFPITDIELNGFIQKFVERYFGNRKWNQLASRIGLENKKRL